MSQRRGGLLGHAEAALEAWVECRPEGMKLPQEQLPSLLPIIAVKIPGGLISPERARRLNELFNSKVPSNDQPPVFLAMLRPCDGQVHFLGFWHAFSEASRIVAGVPLVPGARGLEAELDALQDTVLRLFEEAPAAQAGSPTSEDGAAGVAAGGRHICASAFVDVVNRTLEQSTVPEFWRVVAESVGLEDEKRQLGLEDVAVIMLSWLYDPRVWQHIQQSSVAAALPAGAFAGARSLPDGDPSAPSAPSRWSRGSPRGDDDSSGQEVFLNVYDLTHEDTFQRVNKVFAHKNSPLKFGGLFHAGVEVNGLEWSYGFSMSETVPGISCALPREHPQHHFRQSISLRRTKFSREDIAEIISALIEEYPGDDYDLLRRNCCHFADDFCQRLGVGRIPGWVYRLARIGARVDGAIQVAQGLRDRFQGVLVPDEREDQDEAPRRTVSRGG